MRYHKPWIDLYVMLRSRIQLLHFVCVALVTLHIRACIFFLIILFPLDCLCWVLGEHFYFSISYMCLCCHVSILPWGYLLTWNISLNACGWRLFCLNWNDFDFCTYELTFPLSFTYSKLFQENMKSKHSKVSDGVYTCLPHIVMLAY